jgi:hypothetical protein
MLRDEWIARIFEHMSALYGAKFQDLWRGTEPEVMRRMWASKLSGFADKPKAIKQALDCLDAKPFPPTLPEFVTMCREAAGRGLDAPPMLEHHQSPEEIERAAKAAKQAVEAAHIDRRRDPLQWARDLKARHEAGECLHALQVAMYRAALGIRS